MGPSSWKCWLLLAALVGVAPGCYTPAVTTGWRFEVMKPPTMSASAAVTQTGGIYAVSPLGTAAGESAAGQVSTNSAAGLHYGAAPCQQPNGPPPPPPALSAATACNLAEVCRQLEEIQVRMQRMERQQLAAPRPEVIRALPQGSN
jgi:hypothetical protein